MDLRLSVVLIISILLSSTLVLAYDVCFDYPTSASNDTIIFNMDVTDLVNAGDSAISTAADVGSSTQTELPEVVTNLEPTFKDKVDLFDSIYAEGGLVQLGGPGKEELKAIIGKYGYYAYLPLNTAIGVQIKPEDVSWRDPSDSEQFLQGLVDGSLSSDFSSNDFSSLLDSSFGSNQKVFDLSNKLQPTTDSIPDMEYDMSKTSVSGIVIGDAGVAQENLPSDLLDKFNSFGTVNCNKITPDFFWYEHLGVLPNIIVVTGTNTKGVKFTCNYQLKEIHYPEKAQFNPFEDLKDSGTISLVKNNLDETYKSKVLSAGLTDSEKLKQKLINSAVVVTPFGTKTIAQEGLNAVLANDNDLGVIGMTNKQALEMFSQYSITVTPPTSFPNCTTPDLSSDQSGTNSSDNASSGDSSVSTSEATKGEAATKILFSGARRTLLGGKDVLGELDPAARAEALRAIVKLKDRQFKEYTKFNYYWNAIKNNNNPKATASNILGTPATVGALVRLPLILSNSGLSLNNWLFKGEVGKVAEKIKIMNMDRTCMEALKNMMTDYAANKPSTAIEDFFKKRFETMQAVEKFNALETDPTKQIKVLSRGTYKYPIGLLIDGKSTLKRGLHAQIEIALTAPTSNLENFLNKVSNELSDPRLVGATADDAARLFVQQIHDYKGVLTSSDIISIKGFVGKIKSNARTLYAAAVYSASQSEVKLARLEQMKKIAAELGQSKIGSPAYEYGLKKFTKYGAEMGFAFSGNVGENAVNLVKSLDEEIKVVSTQKAAFDLVASNSSKYAAKPAAVRSVLGRTKSLFSGIRDASIKSQPIFSKGEKFLIEASAKTDVMTMQGKSLSRKSAWKYPTALLRRGVRGIYGGMRGLFRLGTALIGGEVMGIVLSSAIRGHCLYEASPYLSEKIGEMSFGLTCDQVDEHTYSCKTHSSYSFPTYYYAYQKCLNDEVFSKWVAGFVSFTSEPLAKSFIDSAFTDPNKSALNFTELTQIGIYADTSNQCNLEVIGDINVLYRPLVSSIPPSVGKPTSVTIKRIVSTPDDLKKTCEFYLVASKRPSADYLGVLGDLRPKVLSDYDKSLNKILTKDDYSNYIKQADGDFGTDVIDLINKNATEFLLLNGKESSIYKTDRDIVFYSRFGYLLKSKEMSFGPAPTAKENAKKRFTIILEKITDFYDKYFTEKGLKKVERDFWLSRLASKTALTVADSSGTILVVAAGSRTADYEKHSSEIGEITYDETSGDIVVTGLEKLSSSDVALVNDAIKSKRIGLQYEDETITGEEWTRVKAIFGEWSAEVLSNVNVQISNIYADIASELALYYTDDSGNDMIVAAGEDMKKLKLLTGIPTITYNAGKDAFVLDQMISLNVKSRDSLKLAYYAQTGFKVIPTDLTKWKAQIIRDYVPIPSAPVPNPAQIPAPTPAP